MTDSAESSSTSTLQPSMARFDVSLLGPFALYRGDTSLEPGRWPPRAQSLLKLVVTAPDHRRSRDEIVDSLWPDASPEAGAANLRYTLHLLRRMFGGGDPSPILSEKHLIALNPAYKWQVDLDQFEELVRTAGDDIQALQCAAELQRGEPLIEDRYADWAIPVRDRVQRAWRGVCLHLAFLYQTRGAPQEAIGWYERMLESDPIDEEAVLGLLDVLLALNRHTDALRYYQQFVQRLEEELGVPPGPELLAIAQQLELQLARPAALPRRPKADVGARPVPVVPSYPLPATGRLVGREAELEAILAALSDDTSQEKLSTPQMLLLGAEAGMGKTRLLAEAAQRAREGGVLTLAGGCYEQEGWLPYGPVHDALLDYVHAQPEAVLRGQLDSVLPELVRIIPEVREHLDVGEAVDGDPESQRLRLFSSVAQTLGRIARDAPLLILLDDLHWVDDGTLQLLHFLLRQPRLERVLIVCAYRTEEVESQTSLEGFLGETLPTGRAKAVPLRPLRDEELAALLEERFGGQCTDTLMESIHSRSGGNPFFALQVLRLLRQEGQLEQSDDGWRLVAGASLAPPPAVRETVARRLRRLGADEREVLTLGAVLGREFDYAPLETMWEGEERSLFDSLDAAAAAHLVQETERGYAFTHPLLWEVVYWRVPAGRRALLHERAGLKLEEFYGDVVASHAAELAHHFVSAGRVHLDRAVRYLTLAGDAALHAYAWSDALDAYSRALEVTQDQSITARLQEKRGQVLKALARYDEALQALEQAARMYRVMDDMEGEGRVTALIALVHHFRYSWEEGVLRVPPVVERLEQRGASPRTLALLYAALPRVYLLSGRAREGLEAAERAVALAAEVADQGLLADALLVRGRALFELGQLGDAVKAFKEASRLSEAIGDLFTLAAALSFTGQVYLRRGELLDTKLYYEQVLDVAERRGGLDLIQEALGGLGDLHLFLGDWKQARGYVQRLFALPDTRSPGWTAQSLSLLATLSLYQGDWEQALEDVGECRATAEQAGLGGQHLRATALLAEMDLLTGKPEEALTQLEPFVSDPVAESDARFLIPLAWAYVETGALTVANKVLTKAEAAAEKRRTYVPDVLRITGILLVRQGRWDEANRAFDQAVTEAYEMPYPYSEARALYEHGRTHVQKGEVPQARGKLEQALALFQRLGARPYIEWTEQALVRLDAEVT